jgi:hypothetical protein
LPTPRRDTRVRAAGSTRLAGLPRDHCVGRHPGHDVRTGDRRRRTRTSAAAPRRRIGYGAGPARPGDAIRLARHPGGRRRFAVHRWQRRDSRRRRSNGRSRGRNVAPHLRPRSAMRRTHHDTFDREPAVGSAQPALAALRARAALATRRDGRPGLRLLPNGVGRRRSRRRRQRPGERRGPRRGGSRRAPGFACNPGARWARAFLDPPSAGAYDPDTWSTP